MKLSNSRKAHAGPAENEFEFRGNSQSPCRSHDAADKHFQSKAAPVQATNWWERFGESGPPSAGIRRRRWRHVAFRRCQRAFVQLYREKRSAASPIIAWHRGFAPDGVELQRGRAASPACRWRSHREVDPDMHPQLRGTVWPGRAFLPDCAARRMWAAQFPVLLRAAANLAVRPMPQNSAAS